MHAPEQLIGPLPAQTAVGWVAVVDNHRVVTRIPLLLASAVPAIKKSHQSRAGWSYRLRCLDFWWQWVRRSG